MTNETQRTEIRVRGGDFHPVSVARTSRKGVNGFRLGQSASWIWLDDQAFEDLVEAADMLADRDEPQLGKIERFPRSEAVTPAKWRRPDGQ